MAIFGGSKSTSVGFHSGHSGQIGEGAIVPSFNINQGKHSSSNIHNYITTTDYDAIDKATNIIADGLGAVNDAVLSVTDTIGNALSTVVDVVTGTSADNKALSEFAIMEVAAASETAQSIAAESAANNAYLTDAALNNATALAQGFGSDLAYLTDSAMTNNAILVDKTIDTAQTLTENQQVALDNMGQQLAEANRQHADDLGFLTGQNIQANNQLTSQYMQSVEWLTTQTNDALQNFGIWTEAALDSALDVAGNVALDDSVEGLQTIFKYLTIGAAVVGVAWAVKGAIR